MAPPEWMDGLFGGQPPPSRSPIDEPVFPRCCCIGLPLADPSWMWSASTARNPGRGAQRARPGAGRRAGLLTVEDSGLGSSSGPARSTPARGRSLQQISQLAGSSTPLGPAPTTASAAGRLPREVLHPAL